MSKSTSTLTLPSTSPTHITPMRLSLGAEADAAAEAEAAAAAAEGGEGDAALVPPATAATALSSNPTSKPSSPSGGKKPNQTKKKKKQNSRKQRRKTAEEMLLLDTEIEARRRYFLEYLMNIVATEGSLDRMLRPSTTKSSASRGKKSSRPATQSGGGGGGGSGGGLDFIIAEHLADFGNVIAGMPKKKTFRVTNFGSVPVSFSLDKRLPLSHGFTVEPEKVNRLPEGASVDFSIRFKARKSALGTVEVDVPVDIKGGPPVVLRLRANVTVPDIVVTPNKVDFGDVVVGQCRVVTVQVTNTAPVAAEWAIKHLALTGAAARSAARFRYEPDHGTLRPGERQNVRVTFTPTGQQGYTSTAPFRIVHNQVQKFLEVAGAGKLLALSFDPPHIALPTVRPYDPAVRQTVEVINNSDYAVEVYALDFDKQYLEEEELVHQAVDAFDENGVLLVPPREAGAGLPDVLLPVDQAKAARKLAATLPLERKRAVDVLVVGPALSGKTTQAKRLAEKYNIPLLSLPKLVADAATAREASAEARVTARAEAEARAAEAGEELPALDDGEDADEDDGLEPAALLQRNLWRFLHRTRAESQWGVVIDGVDVPDMEIADVLSGLRAVFGECGSSRFQLVQLQFDDPEPDAAAAADADVDVEADAAPAEAEEAAEPVTGLGVHSANVVAALNARSTALEEEQTALTASLEEQKAELERCEGELAAREDEAAAAEAAEAEVAGVDPEAEAVDAAVVDDDAVESKQQESVDGDVSAEANMHAAAVADATEAAARAAEEVAASEQRLTEIVAEQATVASLRERVTTDLIAETVEAYENETRGAIVDGLATLLAVTPQDAEEESGTEATTAVEDAGDDTDPEEKDDGDNDDSTPAPVVDASKVVAANAAQAEDIVFATIGIELDGCVEIPQARSELDIVPDPQTLAIIRHSAARLQHAFGREHGKLGNFGDRLCVDAPPHGNRACVGKGERLLLHPVEQQALEVQQAVHSIWQLDRLRFGRVLSVRHCLRYDGLLPRPGHLQRGRSADAVDAKQDGVRVVADAADYLLRELPR